MPLPGAASPLRRCSRPAPWSAPGMSRPRTLSPIHRFLGLLRLPLLLLLAPLLLPLLLPLASAQERGGVSVERDGPWRVRSLPSSASPSASASASASSSASPWLILRSRDPTRPLPLRAAVPLHRPLIRTLRMEGQTLTQMQVHTLRKMQRRLLQFQAGLTDETPQQAMERMQREMRTAQQLATAAAQESATGTGPNTVAGTGAGAEASSDANAQPTEASGTEAAYAGSGRASPGTGAGSTPTPQQQQQEQQQTEQPQQQQQGQGEQQQQQLQQQPQQQQEQKQQGQEQGEHQQQGAKPQHQQAPENHDSSLLVARSQDIIYSRHLANGDHDKSGIDPAQSEVDEEDVASASQATTLAPAGDTIQGAQGQAQGQAQDQGQRQGQGEQEAEAALLLQAPEEEGKADVGADSPSAAGGVRLSSHLLHGCELQTYGGRKSKRREKYGGWTLCRNGLRKNAVVYSFGLGSDLSFDYAMCQEGCKVYGFDPTKTPKYIRLTFQHQFGIPRFPRSFKFMQVGLGVADGTVPFFKSASAKVGSMSAAPLQQLSNYKDVGFYAKVLSLKSLRRQLRHRWIDVLKVDVEGVEFDVCESAGFRSVVRQVTQLVVEFHDRMLHGGRRRKVKCLRILHGLGFILVHSTPGMREISFARLTPDSIPPSSSPPASAPPST